MRKEKCTDCNGTGITGSLGGIKKFCKKCSGKLFTYVPIEQPKVDKRSKAYKEALIKLQDIGLSKEEAETELEKN